MFPAQACRRFLWQLQWNSFEPDACHEKMSKFFTREPSSYEMGYPRERESRSGGSVGSGFLRMSCSCLHLEGVTGTERRKMRAMVRKFLEWYVGNARDLPWRRSTDPYAIWVSEIMLQQTQVKTVMPYFERWMRALPDIRALAD